ncbi:hypothetical protein JCM3775_001827 [Rhodotorula graminis]|uniref:IMD domain-containing protein n=1 Tax=Rhodotorula graminis (strain WP1) TaxID=578459 RepID=A0A194S2I1_RHOGW|nr:uncharacterized protein RHOBADRAFT_53866 [Rhodotorula graminis WP1]KPV74943.1 hypothetical protein RHOBADRAFT_53866 [Rhodotorula graminis WP1]
MAPSIRSFRGTHPPSSYRDPQLSPTLSATSVGTSASQLRADFGDEGGPRVIVTRADLRESVSAYESLLSTSKAYRNALIALSTASTALAGAMGECARVKGAGDAGEGLLAASGLHYMVANSGQVLSDTLYRSFEVPLMTAYDSYVADIAARHAEYEALLKEKTTKIRETEAENLRNGKKKTRNLDQFRAALAKLTEQVAEVEVCKKSYYSEVLTGETEMWSMIGGKVSLLVRSTLDLADRLASKATTDPVIESMLNEHPDPFDSYRLDRAEEKAVLTILPPMNLGTGPSSAAMSKSNSAADVLPKDGRQRAQGATTSSPTPRQLVNAPVSVSDVLGLNERDDDDEPASRRVLPQHTAPTQDDAGSRSSPSSGRHSRRPSHDPAPAAEPATSSASSSPALIATDSSALPSSSSMATANPFDAPSLLTDESAPFLTSSAVASTSSSAGTTARASKPPQTSPRKAGRRRLSRVSEGNDASADPMAGDWGAPVYGRSLSPAMNGGSGYDSGEEDPNGWRG